MGAARSSDIAVDPETRPVFSPPLSFHRVFSLCACHGSCCHLKLMHSNDFTARLCSVCMVLHSNWWQELPRALRPLLGCAAAGQSGNYYAAPAMMDHAEGMSAALGSVIVQPAWLRETPLRPSVKAVLNFSGS